MVKVAIIGSCGYVGAMLYEFLKDKYNVSCYDIADLDVYPNHIQKSSTELTQDEIDLYDVFIYVAGLSRKEDCEKSEFDFVLQKNVSEALAIPSKMSNRQVFLFSSTGSLYSSNGSSSFCSELDSIDTINFEKYEQSMYEREKQIFSLNKKCVALRFGTVIGLSKNMRPELLHNALFNSAFTSHKLNLWNPNSKRAILWYKDLQECVNLLIQKKDTLSSNDIFNLVSFNTTVLDTAKSICSLIDCRYEVIKDVNALGFYMSNQKFSTQFEYAFQGTNDMIFKYYLENKEKLLDLIQNPIGKHVKCIICKSIRLKSIINLESQPLANNFLLEKQVSQKYPLHLFRCLNCYHTQLDYFVDRTVLFKNYLYESGTSFTLRKYFSDLAERYTKVFHDVPNRNVLELACNDCYQLDEFKQRGWNTYGVDPAENLVIRGMKNGHIIEAKFWGKEEVSFTNDVSFNLIVAQNVVAHVNNPVEFLQKCSSVMNKDTLLVVQTSQANMFFNNEFDTIYHEHISFFTIRSMMRAVESVGCYLDNVYKTDIHGTSYVFEIRKGLVRKPLQLLDDETNRGLYTDSLYINYKTYIESLRDSTHRLLQEYKSNDYSILGYGAAAKGMVFLNYIFKSSSCDYAPELLIDNSTIKHGRFTDGTLIPIYDIDSLKQYNGKKVIILVLAWNFAGEIIQRIKLFISSNALQIEGTIVYFFPTMTTLSI